MRPPLRARARAGSSARPAGRCVRVAGARAPAVALLGGDAAVRRQLAAHDERQRRAQRAARLAGPGRLATRRPATSPPAVARQPGVAAGLGRPRPRRSPAPRTDAAAAASPAPARARCSRSRRATSTHIKTFRFLQGGAAAGRRRARPADGGDAAGRRSATRSRLTPRAGRGPQRFRGLRRRARDRPRPALPAAQPAARPGARPAAGQRRDPAARHVRAARSRPRCARSRRRASARAPQPGAQDGVQWQVQAQLDPAPLTGGSPSAALKRADQTRNRVERSLPGQVQFVDNLSDSLNTAAGDALYARGALHHARRARRADRARARLPRRARHGRARPPRPRAAARPRRHAGATC